MNYSIIKAEITNDPLNRHYSTMDVWAQAANLNLKNIDQPADITIQEMLLWAGKYRAIPRLRALAAGGAPLDGIAEIALHLFSLGIAISLQNTEVQIMLTYLVVGAAFSQAEIDDLIARGQISISRAEQLSLPPVTGQDVKDAMYTGAG